MENLLDEEEEGGIMKPQWINNTFIGPFWMGTPEEIARTQRAIDEEIHLYTDENNDEHTSTETGETRQFEEFPRNETLSCQAPIK